MIPADAMLSLFVSCCEQEQTDGRSIMMFQTLIADTNKTAMTLMQAGMDSVKHTQETMKRQREIDRDVT